MIELILSTMIVSTQMSSESINRFCAYVVDIPYASDDFTQEEWERFTYCRENLIEEYETTFV
jgi:hypothetical protein